MFSRTALFETIYYISDVTTGSWIFSDVSEECNALTFGVKQPKKTVSSLSGWHFVPSGALNIAPGPGLTFIFLGFYVFFFLIFNYALQPLRLIVRSGLEIPPFATRRLHACHHEREPSSGRWNCGREMSGNFA